MAGNTVMKTNPFWGKWAIKDHGRRRPAAYKTGTTSDNRDVAAYGYLAPPKDKKAPALAVGVWMGNSDNSPNDGKLSLDTSAPLWSAILTDISEGLPMANFKSPGGLKKVTVDAFTGTKPGPFTHKTVEEMFIPGHLPPKSTASRVTLQVDAASGLVWREGCVGPEVSRSYFDISEVDSNFPSWQRADRNWASRAARGSGVRGTSKGTRTAYFYNGQFRPFGSSWGAPFAPSKKCPIAPPPTPVCDPLLGLAVPEPAARRRDEATEAAEAAARALTRSATARRSSPRRRPRRADRGAPSARADGRRPGGARRRAGRRSPGRG